MAAMGMAKTWAGGCLALLVAACSTEYEDMCQERVDCLKGSDEDVEACVASYEGMEEQASEAECDSRFEKFSECMLDRAKCERIDGIGFFTDGDRCDDEGERLEDCLKEWRK